MAALQYCNARADQGQVPVPSFSDYPVLPALLTALGIGLLIGMVRERQHVESFAGVRTHALTAMAAALAADLGMAALLAVLAMVVTLVSLAYWRSSRHDPGLTGEVALMLTALLGALTVTQTALAAGLAAVTATLLYAKNPLHRFAREVLSEREVHDGIILLASALIILPLLPDRAIDAFGVLNPARLWRLVVLVMLVGAIAHTLLRVIGSRRGLPLAGFFSGYVSSTAATLNFAQTAKNAPALTSPALAAALFANAASISLFVPILMAMAPEFLAAIRIELAVAFTVLLLLGLFGLRGGGAPVPESAVAQQRMFRIRHALSLVAIIASILYASAVLEHWLGATWAIALALFAASAELHAALIGMAQLVQSGALGLADSHWGLLGLLTVSALVKTGLAWFYGGRDFAWRFGSAMAVMLAAVAAAAWLTG
jgi:uncharacterized membrane protein (DUF4010 family)